MQHVRAGRGPAQLPGGGTLATGVWRCTEAGDEGLEVLAVGAPITEDNDAEIEQGWWAEDDPSAS